MRLTVNKDSRYQKIANSKGRGVRKNHQFQCQLDPTQFAFFLTKNRIVPSLYSLFLSLSSCCIVSCYFTVPLRYICCCCCCLNCTMVVWFVRKHRNVFSYQNPKWNSKMRWWHTIVPISTPPSVPSTIGALAKFPIFPPSLKIW